MMINHANLCFRILYHRVLIIAEILDRLEAYITVFFAFYNKKASVFSLNNFCFIFKLKL